MTGFLSKRIALKVAVTRSENVLFAGTSVQLSAWTFYRLGTVKGLILSRAIHDLCLYKQLVCSCFPSYLARSL